MPRRLPIPLPPAGDETVKSYLQRLAVVHYVIYEEMWLWVSAPINGNAKQRIIVGERLAEATGYPLDRLARGLPELDPGTDWLLLRDTPQPACPRCSARHRGGPVMQLFAHHHYACRRHGYWLGPPDAGQDHRLPHLGHLPDVLAAQRKHGRLVRTYGPLPVFDAIIHAFKICAVLWRNGPEETYGHSRWWRWDRRLDQLIPKQHARAMFSHSRCYAAIYPEAVTIAALLACPAWRVKATAPLGDPYIDSRWELSQQFGLRLGLPNYYPDDDEHPLNLWANHHAAQPYLTPNHLPRTPPQEHRRRPARPLGAGDAQAS